MKVSFKTFVFTCVLACSLRLAGGDFGEELELADFHLSEKPLDAGLWYHRSTLAIRNGDGERAASDADKAEQLAPGKFPTRAVVAQSLAARGRRDEALDLLAAEIGSHPTQPEARLVRARLHTESKESVLSAADYRIAIANLPAPAAGIYLEATQALLDGNFASEANDLIDLAISRLGNDPSLLSKALELDLASKNFQGALQTITDLETGAPRPEPWMAERAKILALAGRTAESRAAWTALRDRIDAMPSLERGTPQLSQLAAEAKLSLSTHPSPQS